MCVDYRALNKILVKKKYPIPLIADCFDQLCHAKFYTKIDQRSGYWQVRIKARDEHKTTCVTRYGRVLGDAICPFAAHTPANISFGLLHFGLKIFPLCKVSGYLFIDYSVREGQ